MPETHRTHAEELAKQPYRIRVVMDETTEGRPVFLATVSELQGCVGHGDTEKEAINDVRLAITDYIESLLHDGLEVPFPIQSLPVSSSLSIANTYMLGEKVRQAYC